MVSRALHELLPPLRRVPWLSLGAFPTPVTPLGGVRDVWIKRDDLSSEVYGGNKVRTLEVLFGAAQAEGATHVYATGAYGTNHGLATYLHAPRVGLVPRLLLFPQPPSACAAENLKVLAPAKGFSALPHWSALPFGMIRERIRARVRGERPFLMVPGGATPVGALGYVSAGLEIAEQVRARALPAPRRIYLAVGSTCTTAGLLVGTQLAAARGIGFPSPPEIVAVRVTPWPVTDRRRILRFARRTRDLLERLAGPMPAGAFRLRVDGTQLGRGYGHPTAAGEAAIARVAPEGIALDTTYSAKAAAALLADHDAGRLRGPALFWATKSSALLPEAEGPLPRAAQRWRSRLP